MNVHRIAIKKSSLNNGLKAPKCLKIKVFGAFILFRDVNMMLKKLCATLFTYILILLRNILCFILWLKVKIMPTLSK